ncbi:MAG: ACP S-malonyltransferase [Bacteroidales bacterium]|nr:ACP S-malonyltransferase [Bacteroidales bacterium]
MKKAYIFPGQGSQFVGMGKDLYENNAECRDLFEHANEIVGFRISDLMFDGTPEDLKQTRVTQPAVFLHSVILAASMGDEFQPDMVGGHSLGEFSALVASKAINFEDGLRLVVARANAMQRCCEKHPSTMAAILKLDDKTVEEVCAQVSAEGHIVVPANYNTPGQLVISGTNEGVALASERLKALKGRALPLAVGGAFHSPLMEPARIELAEAIQHTQFHTPICPCYQNVCAKPVSDPVTIQHNLISQLTSPVRWTETVLQMAADGATDFIEVGPGTTLQGMVKRILQ